MKKLHITLILFLIFLASCSKQKLEKVDPINESFPVAQAELREVIKSIVEDAETANIDGLKSIHLASDKFTKFGPRRFDRQNVESTNESESAHFGSISNFSQEVRDLKIDVFGNVGIATYYPYVSYVQDAHHSTLMILMLFLKKISIPLLIIPILILQVGPILLK